MTLGSGFEPHRRREVGARDRQQLVLGQADGFSVERPADHHPQQDLARRGSLAGEDARIPQRTEDPRPGSRGIARHQEAEAVGRPRNRTERAGTKRRRVVSERDDREPRRGNRAQGGRQHLVERREERRGVRRGYGEHHLVRLEQLAAGEVEPPEPCRTIAPVDPFQTFERAPALDRRAQSCCEGVGEGLNAAAERGQAAGGADRAARTLHLRGVLSARAKLRELAPRGAAGALLREHRLHQPAVLRLHLGHLRKTAGERELAGVAGEDAGDHRADQDMRRFGADPPARELVDRLVAAGMLRCERLAEDPQTSGEGEHRTGEEAPGAGGKEMEAAVAEEEAACGRGVRWAELALRGRAAAPGRASRERCRGSRSVPTRRGRRRRARCAGSRRGAAWPPRGGRPVRRGRARRARGARRRWPARRSPRRRRRSASSRGLLALHSRGWRRAQTVREKTGRLASRLASR